MSLDKFISGKKPSKKKKKDSSSSKKPSSSMKKELQWNLESQEDKSTSKTLNDNLASEKPIQSPIIEQTDESGLPIKTLSNGSLDEFIPIQEFQNKTRLELFNIIKDLVHSSRNYSRNKNLITKLYLEKPDEIVPEVLSQQLEISYYEIIFLLAEIKNQIS